MESNKFDHSIKEKLEGRNLQPSNKGWEQLSGRLEKEDKKQTFKAAWWLGIAASVVGILFVAFQFYKTEVVSPIIVDVPTEISNKETIQAVVDTKETPKEAVKEIQLKESLIKPTLEEIKSTQVKESPVVVVGTNTAVNPKEIIKPVEIVKEVLSFEEQKIQDVVATVQGLRDQSLVVTDAVIDDLLQKAQKQIRVNRMYNASTSVVDANSLLQEVEAELDQSFRSKVFEAIKASYGTVKTAVAQRND
ncbi:hypothetical protein [Mariniflexile sp. AS56]|uniref:hypothetical protein n=1 Tax=Mariniflexile sp. AS56 TaxID=3063957 RepID=UPI0026F031EF|nr:hypothetical protein [Mariniflexile sp. AS56]MDO7173064.1 hypothetical protein [Mariniflexile sp. AS56]